MEKFARLGRIVQCLLLANSLLLPIVSAGWGKSVYELTPSDDTATILEEDSIIFVLYEDKAHEDSSNFAQVFDSVAEEFLVYGVWTMQWFSVDTLEYAEMEDPRVERAIHTQEYKPKSVETGKPQGSYVYVMYDGHYLTLDFVYDSAQSLEDNTEILRKEVLFNYIEPVMQIESCKSVKDTIAAAKQSSLLLFQTPKDDDDPDALAGKGKAYYVLIELARRERFLFGGKYLSFFWMEDINCMSKFSETIESDSIIMFTREKDAKTGAWVDNPRLVNRHDVSNLYRLNRWASAVLCDISLEFNDHVVHTVMDDRMFSLILVRNGGKPRSEEDYEEMLPDDKQAVEAFQKFTKMIKFKQQRILFFYADPWADTAIDAVTTIQEFYGVEFKEKEDLPALMLVDTLNEKIEFLQPIENISEDTIADLVGHHVFTDLISSILQKDTDGLLKAYDRGAPESKPMPANPAAMKGIFQEMGAKVPSNFNDEL